MRKKPIFSIITVCFNEVKMIRLTCESVANQTFRDFEWIVVDGGSTDGTLDVLRGYKSRITHLVSKPDDGIYHAMNRGIGLANGQYLIFMNGGDAFANNQVLEMISGELNADIVIGDWKLGGNSGKRMSYPDVLPANYLLKNMMPHQAAFFRHDLFEKHGGYNESFRIAGDYELFARLLHKYKVSYHHVPLIVALFDGEGISNSVEHRLLRKAENHQIRKNYFPAYRYSPKALRQELRNRIKLSSTA